MSYREDREWSDRWIPMLRALIGPYLLGPSTFEEDTKYAADLVVLSAKDMKIACRVRRHGYSEKYPEQFTIRSRRSNGQMTELEKILDGWGDWLFYGHDSSGGRIDPWWLVNLTVFRECYWSSEVLALKETSNGDGTFFTAFPLRLFPSSLVLGDSVRHRRWVQGIKPSAHHAAGYKDGVTTRVTT